MRIKTWILLSLLAMPLANMPLATPAFASGEEAPEQLVGQLRQVILDLYSSHKLDVLVERMKKQRVLKAEQKGLLEAFSREKDQTLLNDIEQRMRKNQENSMTLQEDRRGVDDLLTGLKDRGFDLSKDQRLGHLLDSILENTLATKEPALAGEPQPTPYQLGQAPVQVVTSPASTNSEPPATPQNTTAVATPKSISSKRSLWLILTALGLGAAFLGVMFARKKKES